VVLREAPSQGLKVRNAKPDRPEYRTNLARSELLALYADA
jgi:hypothetical protein